MFFLPPGRHSISVRDTYGDGWHGGKWKVEVLKAQPEETLADGNSAGWKLVFRQTEGTYYSKEKWKEGVNTHDNAQDNFSILKELGNKGYKGTDGKFRFKLRWPKLGGDRKLRIHQQEWKQTSNPMSQFHVDGYESIDPPSEGAGWGGL